VIPIPNTFGIRAYCRQTVQIPGIVHAKIRADSPKSAQDFPFPSDMTSVTSRLAGELYFPVGMGSNVLWTDDFDGVVVHSRNDSFEITCANDGTATVKVGAGAIWHDFVCRVCDAGWHGLENLALIPGTVGAAVVQNIGAYGVELKDRFLSATVLDLNNGVCEEFSARRCNFGYRDSIFKHAPHYFVLSATFRLTKDDAPILTYPDLRNAFPNRMPSAREVLHAVCQIRRRKLPDPAVVGNAGSFFKNPVVTEIPEGYDGPVFAATENTVKISAAWMIEKTGWKGKTMGNAGVSPGHALVLVNLGGAGGVEVARLAAAVRRSVWNAFGVRLENEVMVMGRNGLLSLDEFD
jgi:UDP-N-acetylmuramate dehydrogenase